MTEAEEFRTHAQHWQAERIETEPMTEAQHQQAVAALAALIVQWRRRSGRSTDPDDVPEDHGGGTQP